MTENHTPLIPYPPYNNTILIPILIKSIPNVIVNIP